MHTSRTLLALPLVLAACVAKTDERVEFIEPPASVHVPELIVVPAAWETAGSSFAPRIRLLDEPRADDLPLRFEYTGPGDVQVPEPVVLPAGALELQLPQAFAAAPCDETGDGLVRVIWPNPVIGDVLVAEWPVLHVQKIIQGVAVYQQDTLADQNAWAASYAVVIELLEPRQEYAEAIRASRALDLSASVPKQGKFEPATRLVTEVDYASFPSLPRQVQLGGDRYVVIVSVAHPAAPATRRAYVKLEADVNGHALTKHVALRL